MTEICNLVLKHETKRKKFSISSRELKKASRYALIGWYWSKPGGNGSFLGGTGQYLVVLGQYWVGLVSIWWSGSLLGGTGQYSVVLG